VLVHALDEALGELGGSIGQLAKLAVVVSARTKVFVGDEGNTHCGKAGYRGQAKSAPSRRAPRLTARSSAGEAAQKPADGGEHPQVHLLLRLAAATELELADAERMIAAFDDVERVRRRELGEQRLEPGQRAQWVAGPLNEEHLRA
jgi:hypothetical protein